MKFVNCFMFVDGVNNCLLELIIPSDNENKQKHCELECQEIGTINEPNPRPK